MIFGEKECEICGTPFLMTSGTQKYCKSCAVEIRKEQLREYARQKRKEDPDYYRRKYREFKERKEKRKAETPGQFRLLDPKKCRTCKYQGKWSGVLVCNYIMVAGHKRGCPAGNCDKYDKQEKGRKRA